MAALNHVPHKLASPEKSRQAQLVRAPSHDAFAYPGSLERGQLLPFGASQRFVAQGLFASGAVCLHPQAYGFRGDAENPCGVFLAHVLLDNSPDDLLANRLGCGTGKFARVLLCHVETIPYSNSIEKIFALGNMSQAAFPDSPRLSDFVEAPSRGAAGKHASTFAQGLNGEDWRTG